MDEWKSYFKKIVLIRGKEYYEDGFVEIEEENEHIVKATVYGSEPYHVYIDLDDLDEMNCTCPYFEKDNCKHIAAVFYRLENRIEVEIPNIPDDEDYDLHEIINQLSSDVIKEEYYQILKNNVSIRNDFLSRHINRFDSKTFINKIEYLIDSTGYYFDSDDEEEEFDNDIQDFLDDLKQLIPNQINTVLQCLMILVKGLGKIEYEYVDFSGEIYDLFEKILQEMKPGQDQDMIFNTLLYFIQIYNKSLAHLLPHYFLEVKYYAKKIEVLQPIIDCIDLSNKDYQSANTYFYSYLQLLENHHQDPDPYIRKYYDFYLVKYFEYELYYKAYDYIKCMELARNHLIDDQKHIYDWYQRLLDLYQLNHDEKNQIDILKHIIIECKKGNMEYYHQLKLLPFTSNDIEEIINHCDPRYLSNIYIEENRLEPLLAYYLKGYYHHDAEVEDALKGKYSDELLQYYIREIAEDLKTANKRSTYQTICAKITRMYSFKEPEDHINAIASYIQKEYSNKRALQEELKYVLHKK